MHLILLGDSTLDNWRYTDGKPTVEDHIRAQLASESEVELRAEDGSKVRHIAGQLEELPPTATHLVLSVGGNDALGHINVLDRQQ